MYGGSSLSERISSTIESRFYGMFTIDGDLGATSWLNALFSGDSSL
jgi:hypothetical protein